MKIENPRYPHTCRILRYAQTDPMEDQPTELDDDPMADEEETTDGEESGDPASDIPESVTVIYEGECRAYDKHTTSDRGEVVTSYRGLALPFTREDWEKLGVVPQEGDKVIINRGGYEEYGQVVDKNPSNFGGTHLIWKYGRN